MSAAVNANTHGHAEQRCSSPCGGERWRSGGLWRVKQLPTFRPPPSCSDSKLLDCQHLWTGQVSALLSLMRSEHGLPTEPKRAHPLRNSDFDSERGLPLSFVMMVQMSSWCAITSSYHLRSACCVRASVSGARSACLAGAGCQGCRHARGKAWQQLQAACFCSLVWAASVA